MRKALAMTTCKCGGREPGDLIMTREWLDGLMSRSQRHGKELAIKEILHLLQQQKQLWFSQSLTAGTSQFWQNKVKTTDELIREIEEML